MKSFLAVSFAIATVSVSAKDIVAVIDISNPTNQITALSTYLSDDISLKLAANPEIGLVERGQLNKILSEQGMQTTGAFDEKTLAKIGSLCGANRILFGKYYPIGDEFEVLTKTVDVASGKVIRMEKAKYQRTESLAKLDQVVPNSTTSTPIVSGSNAPETARTESGPVKLSHCLFKPFNFYCLGEIVTPEAGTLDVVYDESYLYFDNGSKGKFQNLYVADGVERKVVPKIKQSIQIGYQANNNQGIGAITLFHLVYKFNGKSYVIEQAPSLK
jgi:hypothetical protein